VAGFFLPHAKHQVKQKFYVNLSLFLGRRIKDFKLNTRKLCDYNSHFLLSFPSTRICHEVLGNPGMESLSSQCVVVAALSVDDESKQK
jgi:hypothetical protein